MYHAVVGGLCDIFARGFSRFQEGVFFFSANGFHLGFSWIFMPLEDPSGPPCAIGQKKVPRPS